MHARHRGTYVVASDISVVRIVCSREACTDWSIDTSKENALSAFFSKFPDGADISKEAAVFQASLDNTLHTCKTKGPSFSWDGIPNERISSFIYPTESNIRLFSLTFIDEQPLRKGVIRMMESEI